MVHTNTMGFHPRIIFQHINDHPGAFEFVLEMGRVNKDQLIGFHGQIHMFLKNGGFVWRVLVETDFANAKHTRLVQKFGDQGNHIP